MFASFAAFREHLDAECQRLTDRPASSHKRPTTKLDQGARQGEWWTSTGRKDGRNAYSLARNRAFLRAYVAASGDEFDAVGIVLEDGTFIRPDRSVMERSLRDGHVSFDAAAGRFRLTPLGKEFIE